MVSKAGDMGKEYSNPIKTVEKWKLSKIKKKKLFKSTTHALQSPKNKCLSSKTSPAENAYQKHHPDAAPILGITIRSRTP